VTAESSQAFASRAPISSASSRDSSETGVTGARSAGSLVWVVAAHADRDLSFQDRRVFSGGGRLRRYR